MNPRVFLSHSSKDEALTRAVADALTAGDPGHPGFEVLVDYACLRGGEAWPTQLHAMMAFAHAGVLLLSRQAMDRPDWVLKEAYILTWRQSLDPTFKVFYALLDDVTRDEISQAGFAPANLPLIQSLQAKDGPGIAAEVLRLGPRAGGGSSPFEELTTKLAQHLGGLKRKSLDLLAKKLELAPLPWRPDDEDSEVAQIAARILSGELGAYVSVRELINELKAFSVSGDSLKAIIRWVAPCWLTPEAAGRFAVVVADAIRRGKGSEAVINGSCVIPYTSTMFLYRAQPFGFHWRVTSIEGGTNQVDAAFYTGEICKWLRLKLPDDYEGDDARIIALLKQEPPFLVVPLPAPDAATFKTLRDRFPSVVFVLWTGPALVPLEFAGPVVIEPPIDLERETEEHLSWRGARKAAQW